MTAQYHTRDFVVDIKSSPKKVLMDVVVPEKFATTLAFPHTLTFLETNCHSVLHTKCFNDHNLPFKEEVKDTELAHLFEHIILDSLVHAKVEAGSERAKFRGVTKWNWIDNPVGTFEVELYVPKNDQHLLELVLPRAIKLMEDLIAGHGSCRHPY